MKKEDKLAKVMHEWKQGRLTSHGKVVTDYNQAVAIALSEAGFSKKMEEGGGIGFIPMDLEEKLAITAKWGGTNIKGVIGFLNAMIDSGVTDEDLIAKPTKNTRFQRERAEEKKIQEIWNRIEPNYKGGLKGNWYYSTIKRLVERASSDDNILKRYKPFRKYQYAEGGGIGEENALMVANNNKQIAHHTKEMESALEDTDYVPAWVVAKVNRSASDLSDATHYLEGLEYENEKKENMNKYAGGGEIENKIEKLKVVVNSKMLPESVKEKAKAEIERLEKELHESKESKEEEKAEHFILERKYFDTKLSKGKEYPVSIWKDQFGNEYITGQKYSENERTVNTQNTILSGFNKLTNEERKLLKSKESKAEEKAEHEVGGEEAKSKDSLTKELRKLQRELNSHRLSTYIEGDNSIEEKERERERQEKLNRFNEVLSLLNKQEEAKSETKKQGTTKGRPSKAKKDKEKVVNVKKQPKPKIDRKKIIEKAKAKKKTIENYDNKASINQKTGERYNRSESSDKKREALPLGKRVSADGNIYYENRLNHGDFDKEEKFEKGGEVKSSGFSLNFLKW